MWPLDFPNKVSQKSKISIIVKSSKHYIKQFEQLSLYSTLTFSLIEASLSNQNVLEILKEVEQTISRTRRDLQIKKFLEVRA